MASITIVLRDPVTGAGLPNQTVKLHVGPTFATPTYTLSDVTGKAGSYKISGVVTGTYKLFVNNVEDKSFGGDDGREIFRSDDILMKSGGRMTGNIDMDGKRITNLPDPVADAEPETKARVAAAVALLLPRAGGQMTGDIDANSHKITNLPEASSDNEPVRRIHGDVRYIRKESGAQAQQVYSDVIFRGGVPYFLNEPTHLKHGANRYFVESFCQKILSGLNPSAYQQSGNILRVIPSGTAEANKVYRKLDAALTDAESFASSTREMIIGIQGNGVDGAVLTDYNLLPVGEAEPYIHIFGEGEGIIIRVAEDLYDGTFERNIYGRLTFDNKNEDAETNWKNKVFYDCKFTNSFGSGSPKHTFDTCLFLGGCSIGTDYEFTNCKGYLFNSADNLTMFFGGISLPVDITSSKGFDGSGYTPSGENYFGDTSAVMTSPAKWLPITIEGVQYYIPVYE